MPQLRVPLQVDKQSDILNDLFQEKRVEQSVVTLSFWLLRSSGDMLHI